MGRGAAISTSSHVGVTALCRCPHRGQAPHARSGFAVKPRRLRIPPTPPNVAPSCRAGRNGCVPSTWIRVSSVRWGASWWCERREAHRRRVSATPGRDDVGCSSPRFGQT